MLSFVERGTGDVLLFIHAFPLDHSMWDAQAEYFAPRYRIILPDISGFGDSKPPVPWTIPKMGGRLCSLLDSLGIRTCTVIGLSMGGYIALPMVASYPERFKGLVLAHTRARADNEAERKARDQMIAWLEKDGIPPLPDKMLPRLLAPGCSADVREWVRNVILRTDRDAAIHAVRAMRDRADATDKLGDVRCPVLVVSGDEDVIMTVDDCRSLAAGLGKGEIAVIEGAGHLGNLEKPREFNQALERFLDKI